MTAVDTVTGLLGQGGLRFGVPQQAGALTIVPVFHDGKSASYRLFAEMGEGGAIEVAEVDGGSVPDLRVINRSRHAVLLVEGEVLGGLRQTRALNTTVLVPAHAEVTVPVACVEAGRWGAARPFGREQFHASPRVRHPKNLGVEAQAGLGRGFRTDQGGVWEAVGRDLDLHAVASPTQSYTEVHRRRAAEIQSLVAGLRPVEGQRGVLALIGARPAALDVFDRPETLAALWRALVGSYAADALVGVGRADAGEVAEAIAGVGRLALGRVSSHSAVGEGEVVLVSTEAVVSALVVGAAIVHLAAVWPPAEAAAGAGIRFQRPSRRGSWFGGTQ